MGATLWPQLCLCLALVSRSIAAPRQHIHFKGGLASRAAAAQKLSEQWSGCSRGQRYRFVRYEPSAWEVEAGREDACQQAFSTIAEDGTGSRAPAAARNESFLANFDEAVFSRLVYQNVCPGGGSRPIAVPIEPLIGHLRHPYAVCGKGSPVNIEDKSQLLINTWPSNLLLAKYPGRKYLFDMGASTFDTSLTFFTKRFEQAGVLFDEVWAWEMAAYQPADYWARVPDEYKGRVHFYNTAFVANVSSPSHPLNIMRGVYKPGDMVVVKLDIDNAPLEILLIEEIENDATLVDMIAELFFEMHYDHPDMAQAFGMHNGRTLVDVKQRFTALRKMGLYVHYWP